MTPRLADKLVKLLGAKIDKLSKPVGFNQFKGEPAAQATHKIRVSFTFDGRLFNREKFLIIPTAHDIFIGNEFFIKYNVWLHPATKSFRWPESLPALGRFSKAIPVRTSTPPIDMEAQADMLRRDRQMEKTEKEEKRQLKIRGILNNPWRNPSIANLDETPGNGTQGLIEDKKVPVLNVATLMAAIHEDVRRERWQRQEMPEEAVHSVEVKTLNAITGTQNEPSWRTYDGHPIPFPPDEDPSHIIKVREKLPDRLKHLEGFFSKKASTELPPSRRDFDVKLELDKPLEGKPKTFYTPSHLLPLEKETVDELLKIGFIEPCMEEAAASTLFVPKKGTQEKRFCVDYRWVNQFIKGRQFLSPDVKGTIANCRDTRRMTKIDIIRAFNRLLVHPGSRYLTAFKTRQGTFQWKVLPFGLKVGPPWFQAFVNAQLNELLDQFASAYADDVLVYSREDDDKAHYQQVEEVIYRLNRAGLQGDIRKSSFNVTVIDYLGIVLEAGKGVRIDPEKIKAILEWDFKDLVNVRAVRSFLGLCNFVKIFCHHASDVAEPLQRLLKKDAKWDMGPEQEESFKSLQQRAVTAPVLAFFVPGRPTRAETDSSRNGTGGVIMQLQPEGDWRPVGYASKSMTPAERAYPIQDQEMLAVINTIKTFEKELLAQEFFVITDHKALLYWKDKRLLSTRQIRWAEFLGQFDITFQYRPGKENVIADALSRKTVDSPTVKAREIEDRTMPMIPPERIQPTIASVDRTTSTPQGADLVDLILHENQEQNLGRHDGRVVVPETTTDGKIFLRTALIREAHTPSIFAHQGQNKTINFVKEEYWWNTLRVDIKKYIKNCRTCGRNKIRHDKTPGLLHPLPIPNHVWEHVVVDGKDMPKDRHGYDYIWAFICKFSRLIIRLPGRKNDTASKIAERYFKSTYRVFGVPAVWITDNGGAFISEFMETLNELTQTKHRFSSSRHPQTQGAIEITNAELDQNLRPYITKYQDNWSEMIPAMDFAHNVSHHTSIDMPPLKVIFGTTPRNPLSLPLPTVDSSTEARQRALKIVEQTKAVQDLARQNAAAAQAEQAAQANKKRREVDFAVGDSVYVSKRGFTTEAPTTKLDSQYAGPWRILEERGYSFVLDTPPWFKGSKLFHADRLRKAAADPLPQQQQDPETPEVINGEAEYGVDRILASRLFGRNKTLQYQVTWTGWDPDETWYPASNFKNAATRLDAFHKDYPDAAGPPVNLREWLVAAADDDILEEKEDDDVAEHDDQGERRRKRHATRHK
jgi:hypothetical protein